MNSKKEEILAASLRLFNKHGLDEVTTRDIAKEVQISLGNLTYYYPSKSDIVLALTHEVAKAIDEALLKNPVRDAKNTLVQYFHQGEIIFTTQLKYRFIFHKRYGEIITAFPEVQKFLREYLKVRFEAWEQLNKQLVKEKLAKQSLIDDSHAHCYILNILAIYWHQEFWIYFPELNEKQKVQKALAIFFQAYKPYLTKKGLNELNPLLDNLKRY